MSKTTFSANQIHEIIVGLDHAADIRKNGYYQKDHWEFIDKIREMQRTLQGCLNCGNDCEIMIRSIEE